MPPPTASQRAHAVVVLTKKFQTAPYFAGKPESEVKEFAEAIENSMFATHKTGDAFRDHLLVIVSNAAQIAPAIDTFDPSELGSMHPNEIQSKKNKAAQERRNAKRSREAELHDDTRVHCNACGFPRRTRLNINRMGLDSEDLGSQYEYNFETVCECGEDTIDLVINRLDDDEDKEDETQDVTAVETPSTTTAP